jgi:hypothetical protein
MSNLKPFPTPAAFVHAALAAADVQDRLDARRTAELKPYEFAARGDLITVGGYAPAQATRAVLNLREET